jgi:hypothetical protein
MEYPNYGLSNPDLAIQCDCRYNFKKKELKASVGGSQGREPQAGIPQSPKMTPCEIIKNLRYFGSND